MQAEQIAASLSRNGRAVVLQHGFAFGDKHFLASVLRPYERRGLFRRIERKGFSPRWYLTPLGLAVRAILQRQETTDDT